MNVSIIRYILFRVLEFAALFLSLPCLVAIIYQEKAGFSFAVVMAGCLLTAEIGKRWKCAVLAAFYALDWRHGRSRSDSCRTASFRRL